MTTRLTRQITIAVFLTLALLSLMAAAALAFRTARALPAAAVRASHTQEVRAETHALRELLTAAESARRGLLLTADPRFADDAARALDRLPAQTRHLRQLISNDSRQLKRLDALTPMIERRLQAIRAGIAHDGPQADRVSQDEQAVAADTEAIRRGIDEMLAEEGRLFQEGAARIRTAERGLIGLLSVSVGLSIALLTLSYGLLLQEFRRRAVTEGALQDANHELEAFSYAVSHDLRAPLRSIDGFSKALLEDAGPLLRAIGRGHVERIRHATLRMTHLIDDILSLSKVSRAEVKREQVDVSAMAERILAELRRSAPERTVDTHVAPGIGGMADPRLLHIVLENLLGNAWKFTGRTAEPRIMFGVQSSGTTTVLYVRDNGAGFDPAYAHQLFAPFQRLHSEADFAGSGIGLATVQRIVRRHGGRIWAEGKPGAGATFYFTLA